MVNFYESFNLSPELDIKEIKNILHKKHTAILRRLNNTAGDADREYKTRKDLELVEKALEIFESGETKSAYDDELNASLNAGKKGLLINDNPNDPVEDTEESKIIQEMINKKSQDSTKDKPSTRKVNSKAENFVTRAKQFLDAGKYDDALEYINRALDEDATLFSAWETMFHYQLGRAMNESKGLTYDRTFRFPEFTDSKGAGKLNIKYIDQCFPMLDRMKSLRSYFNTRDYKISEVKTKINDIRELRQWLESDAPQNMLDKIKEHYKIEFASRNFEGYFDSAFLYKDNRIAYENLMKYGNNKENMDFTNEVFPILKNCFKDDLNIVYQARKNYLSNIIKDFKAELDDYENRIKDIEKQNNPIRIALKSIPEILLVIASLVVSSLHLFSRFISAGFPRFYFGAVMSLPFFSEDFQYTLLEFGQSSFLMYIILFLVLFGSYKFIIKRENWLFLRIEGIVITATFILTMLYTLPSLINVGPFSTGMLFPAAGLLYLKRVNSTSLGKGLPKMGYHTISYKNRYFNDFFAVK